MKACLPNKQNIDYVNVGNINIVRSLIKTKNGFKRMSDYQFRIYCKNLKPMLQLSRVIPWMHGSETDEQFKQRIKEFYNIKD